MGDNEEILRKIAEGVISDRNFEQEMGKLAFPEVNEAFAKISLTNHKRRILAYMSGVGFDNFEHINPRSVETFREKYPTPIKFAAAKADFLAAIKNGNPEQKYLEYKKAMEEFCREIYGQKQEYFERAEELKKKAEEWRLDQEAKELETSFLLPAKISGDGWEQGGTVYGLTTDLLKQAGLSPRFLLEIGGVEIALSRVFKVDTHEAAIAYVKFDGKVYVRGYYRSNSQGMWRYLADYVGGNGVISWYGVGFNEESLTLPLKLQKQLNMVRDRGIFEITGVNPGFFLGGTAKRYASKEEYKQLVAENKMEGAYYTEVTRTPKEDFGVLSTVKHAPEGVNIEDERAPDYQQQIDTYTMETEMYGEVTVRQFPSVNDELRYTVCEVGKGEEKKVWIGGVEVNAPITSTGLKKEWVSTGDVCTPLLEYYTMAGGYGVQGERIDGYQSMWENYLRRVPLIKKYLFIWRNS